MLDPDILPTDLLHFRKHDMNSDPSTFLIGALKDEMQNLPYSTLYLHTHRFLPGAVDFWKRQGFAIVAEQDDEWQIVHMEQAVTQSR